MKIKIETVKTKYHSLNHKKSFVELIAEKLGMNSDYLQMVWFQKDFKIPPDQLAFINSELDERKKFEERKAKILESLK